jgi:transcriptional regulator with XRE-family HTH domain
MQMENDIKRRIGAIIKKALFEKQMKQSELAKKLNVSRNVVTQWVNGRNIPPGDKLIQLATELGIGKQLLSSGEFLETDIEQRLSRIEDALRKSGINIENNMGHVIGQINGANIKIDMKDRKA